LRRLSNLFVPLIHRASAALVVWSLWRILNPARSEKPANVLADSTGFSATLALECAPRVKEVGFEARPVDSIATATARPSYAVLVEQLSQCNEVVDQGRRLKNQGASAVEPEYITIKEAALIFEDLHWIDAETQDFLDLLVDSVANARLVALVSYRPEYRHEWGSRTCYTQLRLDPLGGQSADEMLQALLGGDASLHSLKRLIIEKTHGNPFFMEEIVRALVEQGVLVRNGATRLTKPLTEIHAPPTVHGILASRIDALSASEKDLLQTLAVIGTDFPLDLVRQMTASADDKLEPVLKSLRAGEFIYEQAALGQEYTFRHVLTQEVAYNSVLMERRGSCISARGRLSRRCSKIGSTVTW